MKILPFGLRSSHSSAIRFRVFDQSFAFIAMQLSIFGFSRNYSPGFFGGTRGIDLPFVSYLSSPFGSDLSLKRTFRPILALLPFRDGGLTGDLTS